MSYKDVVQKFIDLLHPYTIEELDPDNYIDSDDAEAMISDISGFLQIELRKRGCTLIVYSYDGVPTGEYYLYGSPKENVHTKYEPQCIYPREPIYTESKF